MQKLNDLVFLMPEYELEGYPRSLAEDKANQLLSGWISLWHPALIETAGRVPRWHHAARLPAELGQTLFVLPPISQSVISSTAAAEIESAGGLLVQPVDDWREFQQQLLAHFSQIAFDPMAGELVADFAALGYAYLQVQLMTRQLRYTSNLDVALFEEQVLKGCQAATAGDVETANRQLQAAFDTLGQERDHYYSNDAHLIDITLLADTTLGKSLDRQLSNPALTNFIASASMLRRLQDRSSDLFQRLQARVAEGKAALIGGLDFENPWPLLPRSSIVRDLYAANHAYRQLGFDLPTVYGRLSYGLSADSASLLNRFGFRGALLMAFTGGQYPACNHPKISWEAHDGNRLSALAGQPLDANSAVSFLALGWSLGEALDRQHVPTLVLAHWPNRTNQFFELLQIVAKRTPALGKFGLVDRYFSETATPHHHERLDPAQFRYNWLDEDVAPAETVLSLRQIHNIQSRLTSVQNLLNLTWQLNQNRTQARAAEQPTSSAAASGEPSSASDAIDNLQLVNPEAESQYYAMPMPQWAPDLEAILAKLDRLIAEPSKNLDEFRLLREQVKLLSAQCMRDLAGLIAKPATGQGGDHTQVGDGARLLFNPRSNPVRVAVRSDRDKGFTESQSKHFASGMAGVERVTSLDLPAMGFVVAPYCEVRSNSNSDKFALADSGGMLRNEFIEAQIDMQRGQLRSLHVPDKRGNRLSMMVAFRDKSSGEYQHSEMIASQVNLLTASSMLGIVRAAGHLRWQGRNVADFSIDYEIRRGSRIISAIVSLSNLQHAEEKNPWLSAFVLRIAWPTDSAILRNFPDGRRTAWNGSKCQAADLIEIDEAEYLTHYMTGGLLFHARQESRMMETILAVHGQSQIRHRVGFAVDLPHPLPTAQQFVDKPYFCELSGQFSPSSGWLVNNDTKTVQVNLECPLQNDSGHTIGMRIWVCEMQGKSTTANIQFFKDVRQAWRVDFHGNKITKVTASGDTLTISLRSGEQSLIDLLWSQ